MNEITNILEERGKRYGRFIDNSAISQHLKTAMRQGNWDKLASDQRECLEMVAAKISRILTGDPGYVDNWADCAGYFTLVVEERKSSEKTA